MPLNDLTIAAAVDAAAATLRERGYPGAYVSVGRSHSHGRARWEAAVYPDGILGNDAHMHAADNLAEVLAWLAAEVDAIPRVWSDADVAATLGLPLPAVAAE